MRYLSRAQYSEEWNSNLHTHGCAELFFITDGHGRFRTQHEEFPVSIRDLVSQRVAESRFLLRETDHSLSLIAQMPGFSSPSYFSQCFRRVEGISPTEYRRQNRQRT